jgi:lipopolysaccharide export system protein LptA
MCKQFIKKILINLIVLPTICLPALTTYAAKTDSERDISISAKRQESDLKNKIASYVGNVEISQGSLLIKADIVQVFNKTKSTEKTYLAKGNPAIFQQLLEDDTPIILEANSIRYEPGLNMITIEGNAKLSQEGSEVKGSKITYNTLTEQLEAESNENDAVTTILKPQLIEDKQE